MLTPPLTRTTTTTRTSTINSNSSIINGSVSIPSFILHVTANVINDSVDVSCLDKSPRQSLSQSTSIRLPSNRPQLAYERTICRTVQFKSS